MTGTLSSVVFAVLSVLTISMGDLVAANDRASPPCNPAPTPSSDHYIIGYGSLMESSSKARTYQGTGESLPVEVKGFRREWNLRGEKTGATFLGVVVDPKSSFNGVIFQLLPSASNGNSVADAIKQYDKRERNYCRVKVDIKNIQKLSRGGAGAVGGAPESGGSPKARKSEYWIYVNKPEAVNAPAKNYPLIQSYVDVFISGCLELEEKFGLKQFAKKCVTSTKRWTPLYWTNDRMNPKYPTVNRYTPAKIDSIIRGNI